MGQNTSSGFSELSTCDTSYILKWGQGESTRIQLKDFNQDGYCDSLIHVSSYGSGFGFDRAEIYDGTKQTHFSLGMESYFGAFRHTTTIPAELNLQKHQAFKAALLSYVFPEIQEQADPSLAWILASEQQYDRPENHPYFDLVIDAEQKWYPFPFIRPRSYAIRTLELEGEKITAYYGHNHQRDSLQLLFTADSTQYWASSHGIIQRQAQNYRWLFVSDHTLTGSPEKLRWSSIINLQWFDELLILEQAVPPMRDNQFFLIDPVNGKCVRIKEEMLATWRSQILPTIEANQSSPTWIDWKGAFQSIQTN